MFCWLIPLLGLLEVALIPTFQTKGCNQLDYPKIYKIINTVKTFIFLVSYQGTIVGVQVHNCPCESTFTS